MATRPHLTSSVAFALAASEAKHRLQTGFSRLQVAVRGEKPIVGLPLGRLPTYRLLCL